MARVRQRLYPVENVRPPVEPGDSALVSLACVEDDAQGQTLDVLWDIEPDARAYEADRWHGLGTREFDNPALFAAYVNTLSLELRHGDGRDSVAGSVPGRYPH